MVVKSISYSTDTGVDDVGELIQIWCNIPTDNLIGAFPNLAPNTQSPNQHFQVNKFQNGNFVLEFQQTFNLAGTNYYSRLSP